MELSSWWHFIVVSIYRVWFHPLAKYPGPWTAKISDFHGAYHNVMGQLHVESARAHKKYGSVVRQGPNKLIFDSVTALHEIYYSKDGVQKSYGYETMVPAPGAYNIFTAVDKGIHRFKRKMLNQGFSDQSIRAFEPTMLHHIDLFVRNLIKAPVYDDDNEGWSPPLDMTERCRHLEYDIMGEFGFGQSFQLQTKPDNHFLIDATTATSHKAGVIIQYPRLGYTQYLQLDKLFYRKGMEMREKFLRLMARLVKERLSADKDSQNDLFSFLIDAKDPETGRGFTESELWAESRFLLIAGADTSSTALTAIFFYLTAYPECYATLVHEILSTFSSADEIESGPKVASCRYLRACIDEALRMSPPISGTLWREVCPGGLEVDGNFLPPGTDIGVNPYAVHHNEDLYADSYTFKPERWIPSDQNPKEAVERARHAFSVYSFGTRACAGRNMAYMELSDAVAKTIWYTDFRRAEGPLGKVSAGVVGAKDGRQRVKEFQLMEHLTCSHDGPFLQFKGRKGRGQELFKI
ncbi:MAG: hypothetical protein ASARMPREDX12_005965 [Alectoria sarmentosa]|nr:MAG: hypothetical protein ASARMPREDX12_005965 [Alectoria sarmentosa]